MATTTYRCGITLVLLVTLATMFATLFGPTRLSAATNNSDVRRIAEKLQCPVCEGTSVADSPSPVAAGMRDKIRELLDQDQTEPQIISFFRSVYGDAILREPPKTGLLSVLWWGPATGIAVALATIGLTLSRRRRPERVAGATAAAVGGAEVLGLAPGVYEQYRQRLWQEVQERGT
ncbi:MAG: cytochrome c-type biogenesis protein CcmH [Chloroflexi bacterium]|nr:cytochrome c-type biogenesis protein CcmH [Chloroflexota bacterium]